jgi:hypothetical protein
VLSIDAFTAATRGSQMPYENVQFSLLSHVASPSDPHPESPDKKPCIASDKPLPL